jgi:hypothetical protein
MPGGRPSKYDWEDKKDICYQLYVEQKKTPREIVEYFANHFKVPVSEIPSIRLFRRQFKEKWKFPSRLDRLTEENEAAVVQRIRELWEQNLNVKAIRRALGNEGFEISDNDFRRIRSKHKLRGRGYGGGTYGGKKAQPDAPDGEQGGDDVDADADGIEEQDTTAGWPAVPEQQQQPTLSPEEQARRAQRLAQLQLESDKQLLEKKRRRRIRGYGHLGPDDPSMEPRYSSETTLDESKAFLHLTNDMYLTIRDDYEKICQEMDIERKKTSLETGVWQASKDRLIRENMHLSAMVHPLQPNLDKKAVALDVICADVTKRIRARGRKLTLPAANNILGLNPDTSKAIRRVFYDILDRDMYTTRLACGDEHWAELRNEWHASSPVLQQAIAEAHVNPMKMKAVDFLCRDAMKRFNCDKIRTDPNKKQYQKTNYGPGPGSARATKRKEPQDAQASSSTPSANKRSKKQQTTAVTAPNSLTATTNFGMGDVNLDPALYALEQPLPAYFRLSPESNLIGNHPRLWLGKLNFKTIEALHEAALSRAGAAKVSKVHGIIKNPDGSEDSYRIDGYDELEVYLEATGDKATFLVVLEGGYA